MAGGEEVRGEIHVRSLLRIVFFVHVWERARVCVCVCACVCMGGMLLGGVHAFDSCKQHASKVKRKESAAE